MKASNIPKHLIIACKQLQLQHFQIFVALYIPLPLKQAIFGWYRSMTALNRLPPDTSSSLPSASR
jgi:hypothetical protein